MQSSESARLIVADRELRVTRVNDQLVSLNNDPSKLPGNLTGLNLPDNIKWLDRAETLKMCDTILRGGRFPGGGKSYRKIITLSEITGERIVCLLGPHNGPEGSVEGIIYAEFPTDDKTDIGSRNLDPEQYYEYLVERSPDLVFLADLHGRITFANKSIESYTGYSSDEIRGKHFGEFLHADDLEFARALYEQTISDSRPQKEQSLRIVARDGSVTNIVITSTVLETRDGSRILGICRDVTESLDLRKKLLARNSALSALNDIIVALASADTLEDALQAALDKILSALELKKGSISLVEDGGQIRIRAQSGNLIRENTSETICRMAELCRRHGRICTYTELKDRFEEEDLNIDPNHSASDLYSTTLVPLSQNGSVIAVISLISPDSPVMSMEQMEFINLAAGILGPAIANARLHSDLAERANQLATLNILAKSINASRDLSTVVGACLKELSGIVAFDRACLIYMDDNYDSSEIFRYDRHNDSASNELMRLSDVQIQNFAELNCTRVFSDLSETEGIHKGIADHGSAVAIPLSKKSLRLGLLLVSHNEPDMFGKKETHLLEAVAEHLSIAALNAKLYEVEQTRSLELEAIAREAQHRIKNNLQMLAGLLSMSSGSTGSEDSAINRCLRQIMAIATVHDLLSPKEKNSKLELRECLGNVAEKALVSMNCRDRVSLKISGDEHFVKPDKAVALGIIINELVSNAAEHAFCNDRGGVIRLEVSNSPSMMQITITDDGEGLPEDFEMPGNPDCGLGLVQSLTKYGLGGKFDISSESGQTKARIAFV